MTELLFEKTRRTLKALTLLATFSVFISNAEGATLAQLFAGDSITVGNARFTNWELVELDSTTGQNPLLSQIFVTPITGDITQPGLQYSTNGHLAVTNINALDMRLRFRVSTLPTGKAFVGQSLDLTGVTFTGAGGLAMVTQENATPGGADLGSTLVMSDSGSGFAQIADNEWFAHQFTMSVSMDVFVSGVTGTGTVSLTSFTQRFSQTGPQVTPGDFDLDGDVDGRDFLTWQRGGSPTPLSTSDLNAWRNNYGSVGSLGTTAGLSSSAIPEPEGMTLLVCLAMGGFARYSGR